MRHVASLADEALARRFGNYLRSLGIQSKTEPGGGEFEVWVIDEDRVAEARQLFTEFQTDPEAGRFSTSAPEPMLPSIPRRSPNLVRYPARSFEASASREDRRTLSWIIAALAILVFVSGVSETRSLDLNGEWPPLYRRLAWRDVDSHGQPRARRADEATQPWRYVTPMLLHRHPITLGLNVALWLGLAMYFEPRRGSLRLLLLVLVTATAANIAQEYWPLGPGNTMGGLAGVNFGLVGYLWMKSLTDRRSDLELPANLVTFSLVFLTVSVIGLLPGGSAGGPLGGAIAGGLLGYTPRGRPV